MAKGKTDENCQLQEPLLSSQSSFTFQASPSPTQHTLAVDPAKEASIFADKIRSKERTPDTEKYRYFSSLSYKWNTQLGYEDAPSPIEGEKAKERSKIKRRLRNPIQKKSFVKRATYSATHEPMYFLNNLIWGLVLWPKWAWDAIRSQKGLTVLSLKAGIAPGLVSIMCVVNFPDPYSQLSSIAIWAVVTIDILSEANVGLSFSKGVNRVAGTFSAGALAILLTQVLPDIPSSIYPYYVVFWVTLGGFVFRFLKGIPPLKEQWGYAFTVATIAFHILLISTYQKPELVTLPLLRLCMILLGFVLASVVNLAFQPVFAGDTLHQLVAKNFETAADVLLRCVTEYNNFRMFDHVPDILSGWSEDDKIHQSYHEIVMSDSDVDKLLNAVFWEPCHGPFFRGYPWHLYDDITDHLRYTLYDVIALDSCLRASIQAPKHLRDIFSQELHVIATQCSNVLRTLADSMRNMSKFPAEDILREAEEAALALQNKIYIHTYLLLGRGVAIESPHTASNHGNLDSWSDSGITGTSHQRYGSLEVHSNDALEQFGQSYGNENNSSLSNGKNTRFNVDNDDGCTSLRRHSAPQPIPRHQGVTLFDQEGSIADRSAVKGNISGNRRTEIGQTGSRNPRSPSGFQNNQMFPEIFLEGKAGVSVTGRSTQSLSDSLQEQADTQFCVDIKSNITGDSLLNKEIPPGWEHNFMKRRSSLGRDWEGTLERISALSLVKFASLLIEVVAKLKFVVTSVEELSLAANFKEISTK